MNTHLKEIIAKENEAERTTYYSQQLEATYARIERLEEREKVMMNTLQTTMKEHNMIQRHEKNGNLNTELIDESLSKFNVQIKQDFKKY